MQFELTQIDTPNGAFDVRVTIEGFAHDESVRVAFEFAEVGDADISDRDVRESAFVAVHAVVERLLMEGLYYCASENCPGYPYRASDRAHPCKP